MNKPKASLSFSKPLLSLRRVFFVSHGRCDQRACTEFIHLYANNVDNNYVHSSLLESFGRCRVTWPDTRVISTIINDHRSLRTARWRVINQLITQLIYFALPTVTPPSSLFSLNLARYTLCSLLFASSILIYMYIHEYPHTRERILIKW